MTTDSFTAIVEFEFGILEITTTEEHLTGLDFLPPGTALRNAHSALANQAAEQIAAWCKDPEAAFNLPYQAQGTPFQQRVWQVMLQIPCGSTSTYGDVAKELNSSARAVGGACGKNPLPIIIPCHRIVGRHALGGFNHAQTGWLVDIKRWLLKHELQIKK